VNRHELREWRRARYLSQTALGELLGVVKTTCNRWEVGETNIPPFLYLALERLDQLYTFTPDSAQRRAA